MQRRIESFRSSTAPTVADMAPSCACCGAQSNIPLNLTPRNARTADLLNSNACPLHVEELSFRAEIPARKNRILRLDRAIADARRAVQDLIHQRQQEVRDLNDIETVMHPIRRLPADVLREIFVICLDDQDPRADSIDTNGMPWALVQVCSQWRTTGVSFARLWSRVHVSFDTLALHPHPERLVHVLWLQLSRSKQYRLDMELSSYTHVSEMHPILPQLWSSSNRWRTLTIDVTDASVRNILAPTYGKLHALELVSIKTSDLHHDEHPDFDILSNISTTPLLRSLHVNQTPMSLVIPWDRLEEYVCYQPNFGTPRSWFEDPVNMLDKNLAVLSKLTNVQTFKTRFSAVSPPSPMEQPLNHHCLTSLWLESPALAAEIGVSEFLKVLVLPSLQTLGWLRWSDVAAARALVERSKCTLLTLGIKPDTHSTSLRDFMRDSSSVETLVLKDQVDPAFFAILGGVLPELINLDMSEVIPAYAPEDKVWRIVTTRKKKLKDVRLPPGYESTVPVEEQFASFIWDGLNIGIYYA